MHHPLKTPHDSVVDEPWNPVTARFHLVNLDPVVYPFNPHYFPTLQYLPIPYNTYLFTCCPILPNSLPYKECLWDHQENFNFRYGSMKWFI